MYEKFVNRSTFSNSSKYNANNACESRETLTRGEIIERWLYINHNLGDLRRISLEADEDNPFGDIGEGMDDAPMDDGADPFASDGGMSGGDSDPFGGIGDDTSGGFDFDGASDDGGDIFGGDGDDQRQQSKQVLLDRAKSIKEDFDISRQVRANFPKKFLELKTIISNNLDRLRRTVLDKTEYESVLSGMIVEYERMEELIEAYIEVMAKKPYEDIFATYVSIHTNLIRLKNLYIEITGLDKKEVELEESKYDTTI